MLYISAILSSMTSLQVNVELEAQALRYSNVHKVWGMVELQPQHCQAFDGVDLVVAFDISASMRLHSDMINWIKRFIDESLIESDTLTFITFNHEIQVLTECLLCTKENKIQFNKLFGEIKYGGETNLIDCLKVGTAVLKRRTHNRPCVFAIFTDGIRHFNTPNNILAEIAKLDIPSPVHTFGLGNDQDSGLLRSVAHQTHGVYQNIQTSDQVPMIINSFMNLLHHICAIDVCITLKCHDGARLNTLATPYNIKEKNLAKEYTVTIPAISNNNSKTILFRLSLRKMDKTMSKHQLITINVSAKYQIQGQLNTQYGPYAVTRPAMALFDRIPNTLDYKMNRYITATAITEAIEMAEKQNFTGAINKLKKTITSIQHTVSSNDMSTQKIIKDLEDCIKYVENYPTFMYGGAHSTRMIASEYFMEYQRTIPLRWSYPTPQLTYIIALAYSETI